MRPIKILLVDDNIGFLETIADYFATIGDEHYKIVGKAITGNQSISLAQQLQPDIILMDIALPDINGFEAARLIKQLKIPSRIIMLTIYDTEQYRKEAIAMGLEGFVSKMKFVDEIVPLLRSLFNQSETLIMSER